MQYLIGFAIEKDVMDWSATHFTPPVSPDPSDVTKYYFSWLEKEDTKDEWAAIIPAGTEGMLTSGEQLGLKDNDYMNTSGWFPVVE